MPGKGSAPVPIRDARHQGSTAGSGAGRSVSSEASWTSSPRGSGDHGGSVGHHFYHNRHTPPVAAERPTPAAARSPGTSADLASPPTGSLLGTSPSTRLYGSSPSSAGRHRQDAYCTAAKKFFSRVMYDPNLRPEAFTAGVVEGVHIQERKSGAGAWSMRQHHVVVDVPVQELRQRFPEGKIPFHKVQYFKENGTVVWEQRLQTKPDFQALPIDAGGAAGRPPAGKPGATRGGLALALRGDAGPSGGAGGTAAPAGSILTAAAVVPAQTEEWSGATPPRPGPLAVMHAPTGECLALYPCNSVGDGRTSRTGADSPGSGRGSDVDAAESAPPMPELPDDVWRKVALRLGTRELCMMARTCRSMRALVHDSAVWATTYERLFGQAPSDAVDAGTLRRMCRRSELKAARWLGREPDSEELPFHGASCVQLDSTKVVSGEGDSIRLWSHLTGAKMGKLRGHNGRVNCVAFNDELLLSGCTAGIVKLWALDELKCLRTVRGHAGPVTGAELVSAPGSAGVPVTCSADGFVRVWDAASPAAVAAMEAPGAVSGMSARNADGRVVTASWSLDLWDIETAQHAARIGTVFDSEAGSALPADLPAPDAAAMDPFTCVSASQDLPLVAAGTLGEVRLYDLRSASAVARVAAPRGRAGHQAWPIAVQLDGWQLVTAFRDGDGELASRVLVYDVRAVQGRCAARAAGGSLELLDVGAPAMLLHTGHPVACFRFFGETLVAPLGGEGRGTQVWRFGEQVDAARAARAAGAGTGEDGGAAEERRGKGGRKKKIPPKPQTRYPKRKGR